MLNIPIDWLLECDEPWTRYRTRRDLLVLPEEDPLVQSDRQDMLQHPMVQALLVEAATCLITPSGATTTPTTRSTSPACWLILACASPIQGSSKSSGASSRASRWKMLSAA